MVTSRCAAIFQQIQTSVWWWGCGDRQQYIQECVWRASQSQGWWHCDINGKNVIKNCRMSTAAFNLRIYGAVSWLLMRFQDLMMYCEAWVMWKQQKSHQFCSYWGPLSEDHIQRWLKAELKKKRKFVLFILDLIHSQCTNLFIQMFSPALFCEWINSNIGTSTPVYLYWSRFFNVVHYYLILTGKSSSVNINEATVLFKKIDLNHMSKMRN